MSCTCESCCGTDDPTVPCRLCGTPTRMTGTALCDPCWELERRVSDRPGIALMVLQQLIQRYKDNENAKQAKDSTHRGN